MRTFVWGDDMPEGISFWPERLAQCKQSQCHPGNDQPLRQMHNLSKEDQLCIRVFMLLKRLAVVCRRIGVCMLNEETFFCQVVVPVCRLVVIKQHDRRDGDVNPDMFPGAAFHGWAGIGALH